MTAVDHHSLDAVNSVLSRVLHGASLGESLQAIREHLAAALPDLAMLIVIRGPHPEPEVVSDRRLPDEAIATIRLLGKRLSGLADVPGIPFGPSERAVGAVIGAPASDPAWQAPIELVAQAGFQALWVMPVEDPLAGPLGWIFACTPERRAPCAAELSCLTLVASLLCLLTRQQGLPTSQETGDYDPLTGLPGRAIFLERLGQALARRGRRKGRVGVIVLDFDRFRIINNSFGVDAGNQVLVTVARRLRKGLRRGDTLARLERDEFAILLEGLQCERDAVEVAERMMQRLHRPIPLTNREVMLTASFGIALSTETSTPADLMREAEMALADARSENGGYYKVFSQALDRGMRRRLELEIDLLRALERGEFSLNFQPVIELETGRMVELEALLRWEHAQHGRVSPGEFIPIAEETGLIIPIGRWALREAARLMRDWLSRFPHLPPELKVSVNFSPRQLRYSGLVQEVVATLDDVGLPPGRLKIEITESLLVDSDETVLCRLQDLRAHGIELALDDFGTGYSSLGYLSGLPVDCLKIDRTFIERLGQDQAQAAIIQTIVSVARALGLNVVGEGIETEMQLVHLRALGCTRGQGYYIARPLSADGVATLFQRGLTLLLPAQKLPGSPPELLAS
uniref:Bifunctional diguanylate cyclase/phosphodiesterase n=1 Tax=Thermorudis peleae TaxID=1382356 RepID=A0A831TK68_9BACT